MQRSKSETNKMIGHKIKALRMKYGKTLENLAECSGLSLQTVKAIERGVRSCNVWTLICIADALSVSAQFLIQDDETYLPDDLKILIESMNPLQIALSKNLLYAVKMTKLE